VLSWCRLRQARDDLPVDYVAKEKSCEGKKDFLADLWDERESQGWRSDNFPLVFGVKVFCPARTQAFAVAGEGENSKSAALLLGRRGSDHPIAATKGTGKVHYETFRETQLGKGRHAIVWGSDIRRTTFRTSHKRPSMRASIFSIGGMEKKKGTVGLNTGEQLWKRKKRRRTKRSASTLSATLRPEEGVCGENAVSDYRGGGGEYEFVRSLTKRTAVASNNVAEGG